MTFKVYKNGEPHTLSKDESVALGFEDLISTLDAAYRDGVLEGRKEGTSTSGPKDLSVRMRYLETIADLLPASLFAKNREGRYQYVNSTFIRMAGVKDADEMIGKLPSEVFQGKRGEIAEQEDREVFETGIEILGHENYHRGLGLENIWVMVSKSPVIDADGEVIGIVGMVLDINDRKVAEERLKAVVRELECKNQILEQDLNLARNVQQSLLPQADALKEVAGVDVAFRVRQSERLGGDFLHVKPMSVSSFGVFICDVMGHGVQAAFITSLVKGLLGDMRRGSRDPGKFISSLNSRYCESMRFHEELIFATALYLEFDTESNVCRFANAGHILPQWLDSGSGQMMDAPVAKTRDTCALGVISDTNYLTDTFRLAPGDLLTLCTDGLIEIQGEDGEEVGKSFVREAVLKEQSSSSSKIVESVLKEAKSVSAGELEDDISLVVIKALS